MNSQRSDSIKLEIRNGNRVGTHLLMSENPSQQSMPKYLTTNKKKRVELSKNSMRVNSCDSRQFSDTSSLKSGRVIMNSSNGFGTFRTK